MKPRNRKRPNVLVRVIEHPIWSYLFRKPKRILDLVAKDYCGCAGCREVGIHNPHWKN